MTPTRRKPPEPVEPPAEPARPAPPKIVKRETVKKPAAKVAGQRPWEKITGKLLTPKAGVSAGRQKAMVILIPVLFIVMIFVLTRVFSTPSPVAAQPAHTGPTGSASGSKEIEWEVPELYPTGLRDPMQIGSTGTVQVKTSELVVKGIVYSEDNPSAVVSNEIVHEGEEVMGARVVKINSDSVVFEMDGMEWTQKVER
jgi:type II secretory pathway component PulC